MKTKVSPDEAQSARFIEAARKLGCDESPDAFEAAVKKVARHKAAGEKAEPKIANKGSSRTTVQS